jgi:hypothetical protein
MCVFTSVDPLTPRFSQQSGTGLAVRWRTAAHTLRTKADAAVAGMAKALALLLIVPRRGRRAKA